MFGFKSNKPRERFYLLPGQGGRSYRRKQQMLMRWTVSVALVFGLILAAVMWWLARRHP
ncbi:MAG TPA: hypothetical protein VF492_01330 [Verrucomicrobiae bacterium]